GSPIKRREDERLLTGRGRFVADLVRPGVLHAAFLRSPHAHTRIRAIETRAARASAGVVAVVTADDMRGDARPIRALSRMRGCTVTEMPALASGTARYAGEAVAAVVAENRYAAEDAVERIVVDYLPLAAVIDPREAMSDGAPLLHEAAPRNVIL